MAILFKNNAASTLTYKMTNAQEILYVADASVFPVIADGSGDVFKLTLVGEDTLEIVEAYAVYNPEGRQGFRIRRAQEGTTAQAWPAGTRVELRITADALNSFVPTAVQIAKDYVDATGVASTTNVGFAGVDGQTTQADAGGVITVKDVAIGGDLGDLASARGIFDTLTKNSVDCNTLTEQGVYAISLAGTVNGPGFSAKLIVFNGKNSKFTNQMALAAGAGTSGAVRVAYRAKNSEDIWSPWSEGILSGRIGDGITVTNGIISVPEYEGATASTSGTSGLVPPATAGQQESFLTGGGEYKPALTKISDSVNLADSKTAASATAVKAAYDRGTEALTVAEAALPKTGGDLSGQLTINGDSVARAGSNTKFNRAGYSSSPPLVWGGTHDDLINYNLYFTDQLRVYGANRAGSLCSSGNLDSAKTTTFIWDASIETSWLAAFNSDGSNLHPVSPGSLSVYTSASLQGCVARAKGQPIGLAGTWLVIFVGNNFNIKATVSDGGAIPATENKDYVAIRIQ